MNTLITIPISHYCEKARWALDHGKVAYTEEQHMQALHLWFIRNLSVHGTVPVLVTENGVLDDSSTILKWAAPDLYPTDDRLEELFNKKLGPATRLWMYSYMLSEIPLILRYTRQHKVSVIERTAFRILFPFVKKAVIQAVKLGPNSRSESHQIIDSIFNEVADILGSGRKYLNGNQFSAVDLTFSSLAAAVLIPENYGVALPNIDELPKEMADQVRKWRVHPAGQFAFRIYKDHRRRTKN